MNVSNTPTAMGMRIERATHRMTISTSNTPATTSGRYVCESVGTVENPRRGELHGIIRAIHAPSLFVAPGSVIESCCRKTSHNFLNILYKHLLLCYSHPIDPSRPRFFFLPGPPDDLAYRTEFAG